VIWLWRYGIGLFRNPIDVRRGEILSMRSYGDDLLVSTERDLILLRKRGPFFVGWIYR
jgi:hypothetical protein